MNRTPVLIPIKNIFLDIGNPRFKQVKDEDEEIELLCRTEKVYEMAQDIVEMGFVNPMEILGVVPLSEHNGEQYYTSVEGNRRLCALKLLEDPERAPNSEQKKKYQKLAQKWTGSKSLFAVVFDNKEEAKPWLERLHGGEQGGVGRRHWNAEQKTRFSGTGRNVVPQALLDYAADNGWLDDEGRKNLLSTAARFVSNPGFREELGIDTSEKGTIKRTRPKRDFDKGVRKFVEDLQNNAAQPAGSNVKRFSRFKSPDIEARAKTIVRTSGMSEERCEPENIFAKKVTTSSKKKKQTKPKQPPPPPYLTHVTDIENALETLDNQKLQDLYFSITSISLKDHPVIISVGIWSFLECLISYHGSSEGTDIVSYLSYDRLEKLGVTRKDHRKTLKGIFQRTCDRGNESKHHSFSGSYDAKQINNDWQALSPVILALAIECVEKENE